MIKVLLPVDGSVYSDHAVEKLAIYAKSLNGAPEIHLLHVHAPIPVGRVQQHIGHDMLERYYREESEAHMASAEALLQQAGLLFVPHIHVGPAAELIVKLAADLACDIICMGTHGRGAFSAAILGSVAGKVLHLAACPVMLVK